MLESSEYLGGKHCLSAYLVDFGDVAAACRLEPHGEEANAWIQAFWQAFLPSFWPLPL